jgi:hypothetical protein
MNFLTALIDHLALITANAVPHDCGHSESWNTGTYRRDAILRKRP